MAKMWAGRFSKETDPGVNDFNSSIAFDARMYRVDIRGSMAHAAMLGKTGIISEADAETITEGLKGILADLDSGALAATPASGSTPPGAGTTRWQSTCGSTCERRSTGSSGF